MTSLLVFTDGGYTDGIHQPVRATRLSNYALFSVEMHNSGRRNPSNVVTRSTDSPKSGIPIAYYGFSFHLYFGVCVILFSKARRKSIEGFPSSLRDNISNRSRNAPLIPVSMQPNLPPDNFL